MMITSHSRNQGHAQGGHSHGGQQNGGGSSSHRRRSLSSSQPTKTRSASSATSVGTATNACTANTAAGSTATTAVEDQLRAMLSSEDVYTPSLCLEAMAGSAHARNSSSSNDHMSGVSIIPQHHAEWRSKICEWSYRVIDHFRYDREVVSVAMNYFDRYLVLVSGSGSNGRGSVNGIMGGVNSGVGSATSAVVEIDSRTYQLAAMAALYVATKLHADQVDSLPAPSAQVQPQVQAQAPSSSAANASRPTKLNTNDHHRSSVNQHLVRQPPPTPDAPTRVHRSKLRLSSFVELSRGQFSAKDITTMERQLLDVLGWRVNPPTPMVFVSHLLRVMPLFGRPNATGSGTIANSTNTSLQHRTLVLHVLHELSRYLTELSICLPPSISSHHISSELAFVAILLSLDLLSDVTAVPRGIRESYLRRLDWLSGGRLNASRTKMVALKDHIGKAFVPDMLQDSLAAMGGGEVSTGSACGGHPIVIARDAGLLAGEVERRCGGRCFNPTPTSISDPSPNPVAPSVAAAEMEVEVEFNPPPSEPAIVNGVGDINTSFDSDPLVVSGSASLAGASVDSFEVDIDDDDIDVEDLIAAENTTIDPETGRNRSVNCVAEQAVMQLHSTRNTVNNNAKSKTKRSDKYIQHQHPFHAATNTTSAAVLAETLLENTTSTGTVPPGHVRKSSCSSWMSDSSESPISVIAEALNAAAGGVCGSAPHQAASSGGGATGQARPPTHHAHHQAPAQGYLL